MAIVIDPRRPERRAPDPGELQDEDIEAGAYFGTTGERGSQLWHFDGEQAVRVGVAQPDARSMVTLANGETLRAALRRVPMFAEVDFLIHRMHLPPGGYYPRMSRPHDQHPLDSPGMLPGYIDAYDLMIGTLNQVRVIVGMLEEALKVVQPHADNMTTYGSLLRNILMLACTECEAQWRGILAANDVDRKRPSTIDYFQLCPAMRLPEYSVKFGHYPWLEALNPYQGWVKDRPTESLAWYADYNAAKHDRDRNMTRATLASALSAVAGLWVIVAAQFGAPAMREFSDLDRYFHLVRVPLWRFSEVYSHGYHGFDGASGPRPFVFAT